MSGPEIIKAARERAGLTQQALAERARLALRTVQGIEAGGRPSLTTLERLADALGIEDRGPLYASGAWPVDAERPR